jgi:hypothetical protein
MTRSLLLLLPLLAAPLVVHAQETYAEASSRNVAIALRGGVALASPRGDFPSLIIGTSKHATGRIGQALGESRAGSRFDLVGLFPIDPAFGISAALGTQVLSVAYRADSNRHPTLLDVQSLQGGIGVQWSFVNEETSYVHGGLRSVYVDGGLDVGIATLANRVEGTAYDDTLGTTPRAEHGSFEGTEPFRNVIALRFALGMRFAATPNLELIAEGSYAYALNPFFSGEAIENNDFAIDVMGAVLGVGYRF